MTVEQSALTLALKCSRPKNPVYHNGNFKLWDKATKAKAINDYVAKSEQWRDMLMVIGETLFTDDLDMRNFIVDCHGE